MAFTMNRSLERSFPWERWPQAALLGAVLLLSGLAPIGLGSSPTLNGPDPLLAQPTGMQAHGMACTACHVPVPEGTDPERAAWWSPAESGVGFRMYVTTAGNKGALDGPSLLCLGCHDGVTAPDQYGGKMAGTFSMPGRAVLGTDLSNDHPIGIAYPPRSPVGELLDGYFYSPRGGLALTTVNGTSRVECTSCHDPHGTSYDKMLRETATGSAICFGCHDI